MFQQGTQVNRRPENWVSMKCRDLKNENLTVFQSDVHVCTINQSIPICQTKIDSTAMEIAEIDRTTLKKA